MRNLLNKINLNRTRTIYFLATFVMIIGCYALNKSYSMFVQNESKKAVGANVPSLNSALSINSVVLNSGEQIVLEQIISNSSTVNMDYILDTNGTNYIAKLVDESGNDALSGTLEPNSNKKVHIYLKNNSNSLNKVNFVLNKKYTTVNKSLSTNIDRTNQFKLQISDYFPYSDNDSKLTYKIMNNTSSTNSSRVMDLSSDLNSNLYSINNSGEPFIYYESTNQGKSNTSSVSTLTFTTSSAGKLSLDYYVSSESANYDYLTITLKKGSNSAETILNKTGGENKTGTITKDLESGQTYIMTFTYRKDGSVDKYDDLARISNLKITSSLNGNLSKTDNTYSFKKKSVTFTKDFVSNNKGISSSSALSEVTFTTSSAGKLSLDYYVSSESANYDYLTITLKKGSNSAETILNKTGGENKTGTITKDLESGQTYILTFTYRKDGSVNKYDDLAKISNLIITSEIKGVIKQNNSLYAFPMTTKVPLYSMSENEDSYGLPSTIDITKVAVSTTFKNTLSDTTNVTDSENGLFSAEDNDGKTYYYRGAISNNYVSYGTDKSTNNKLLWRILRINGDGTIRLILNDIMDYSLLDYNGNKVSRNTDSYIVKRIFPINHTYSMKTDVYIPRVSTTSGTILKRTIGSTSIDYSLDNYSYNIYPDLQLPFNYGDGDVSNSVGYSDGYVYYKIMNNWANKIVNLPTSNLVNGKFCVTGRAAYYNDNTRYYPNLDFKCDDNVTMNVSSKWSKFGNNTISNSYFGYISYAELLMAGFSSSNTFADSDTFINNKENYITGTITANYSDNTTGGDTYDTYYVASNGGIITERTEQYRKTECSGCIDSVEDSSGNTIYGVNRGKSRSLKLLKLRPVINLKSDVIVKSGDGTKTNPYILAEN